MYIPPYIVCNHYVLFVINVSLVVAFTESDKLGHSRHTGIRTLPSISSSYTYFKFAHLIIALFIKIIICKKSMSSNLFAWIDLLFRKLLS